MMKQVTRKTAFSIRVTVVSIFIFASVLTATIAIGLQYYFGQKMAHSAAVQLYDFASDNANNYIAQEDERAANYTLLLANFTNLIEGQRLHPDAIQLFTNILLKHELYYSLYLGFPNGDLQQLVNLTSQQNNRINLQAKESDRWALVSITGHGNQRKREILYYDQDFNLRAKRQEKTNYYANKRPWYHGASTLDVYKSEAYLFAQSQKLGQTYSVKVPKTDVVLGLDITLDSLSNVLKKRSADKQGNIFNEVYIYKNNGDVLASNQNKFQSNNSTTLAKVPYPELIQRAKKSTELNQLTSVKLDEKNYYVYIAAIDQKYGKESYLAIIVPAAILFSDSMARVKTSIFISMICLILLLPLSWLFSSPIIRPIKALAIEVEKVKHRHYESLRPITSNIVEIQALSDSMVDMSDSIEVYQTEQKQLMESFIQLIAQAIDEKSPYTAGHCNRVPELGLMLAKAAEESDLPPFKTFRFNNADEHREFRIAAWLHDCGKITTPEHIVDKGTKLEAIYNRIHEVRMRFEVLWRDAELNYYKACAANPENTSALKETLIKQQLNLTQDFEFIAKSNVGSEFMAEQDITRLAKIGKQTWDRYFDDRLGLSPIEELNLHGDKQPLPAQEKVLCDKNEHIIKRDSKVEFDPKFDIKMEIPEHLYNLGELYNLSITRGTLTTEDRFKINQHVTSTIKMLENLPFPPELANVPRYASTHHETLKGTGYPRKLSAQDLSIPERILVVADIFEALTAADRPYKKAKPISVAVDILHKMALDQHIDMDIFQLFLSSGIYLKYAHQFLDKTQINEVDISQYLS